jgi:RNA polymerase sigma-70 factor (ECF subfamily)
MIEVTEDAQLVEALRRGDEQAFMELVDRYQASLLKVALTYLGDKSSAQEVVQDTWLGVLQGLPRFEARSSLKTWIFGILMNSIRKHRKREARAPIPTVLEDQQSAHDEPAVDQRRFASNRHWSAPPASWSSLPETRLLSGETLGLLRAAILALPENQRAVITLRDVEGMSSAEACNVLALSETNQRVLLHRARSRLRRALEPYLADE